MTDIVDWLRNQAEFGYGMDRCNEAAEEIERLRQALRKIAALKNDPGLIADDIADDADAIARAALEEKKT